MRACDGCNKCCEGWVSGSALGKDFWPGRPCHYKTGSGCAVYDDRPHDPCQTFHCGWLQFEQIPIWMKPNECGVIVVPRQKKGEHYLDFIEAGERMNPRVLSWLLNAFACGHLRNIRWQLDGGWNYAGSTEFIEIVQEEQKHVPV